MNHWSPAHLDLLKRTAGLVHHRWPRVEFEELMNVGWLALRWRSDVSTSGPYLYLVLRSYASRETRGYSHYWWKKGVRVTHRLFAVPPEDTREQVEMRDMARAALGILPPREAQIVAWRCRGLSFREIAGELGMTQEGVRKAYQRAVGKLRKRWAA